MNTAGMLPLLNIDSPLSKEIICRTMMLNCITSYYAGIWGEIYDQSFRELQWTKNDNRLSNNSFLSISDTWNRNSALRNPYARRQAMVEIDVLVSMMLGMTLRQLVSAYRIQFPTLQQHERDTYYDKNGIIVYAKNNALAGVGVSKGEFEANLVGHKEGKYVYETMDYTLSDTPITETTTYVAPFDRCDREKDYETAWKFFEEKYGKEAQQ